MAYGRPGVYISERLLPPVLAGGVTANAAGASEIALMISAFFKKAFISSILNQIGAMARYKDDKTSM